MVISCRNIGALWTAVVASLMITYSSNVMCSKEDNVNKAIDVIMKFCGGKSTVDKLTLNGDASGELSLSVFKRKVGGNVSADGKIIVEKSNIEGVVNGLNGEINKLNAVQASEFRKCAKPYIDRLINEILPKTSNKTVISPSFLVGWWAYKYDGSFQADPILIYTDDSGRIALESGMQARGEPNQFFNVSMEGDKITYSRKVWEDSATSYAELRVVNDSHLIGITRDYRGTATLELKRKFPGKQASRRSWCPEPIPERKCP